MTKLMIIGAGGHGRVVADCAEATKQFEQVVFADAIYSKTKSISHWPIVTCDKNWRNFKDEYEFIVAIGNNNTRLKLSKEIEQLGGKLASLVHPKATVSQYATIGDGSVIFANALVSVDCQIGVACIINHNASIDHDVVLGDGCHIAPGCNISGGVKLGQNVWAGVGATIIQSRQIANDVYLGAGTVVISDIAQRGTYVGNPARKIKESTC